MSSMRYVGEIINAVRKRTKNTDSSVGTDGEATSGVTDDLILEFLNDGQDYLQGRVLSVFPDEFVASKDISVDGSSSYEIADRVFMDNRLISVKYSVSGRERDFRALSPITIAEQSHDTNTHPYSYVRKNGAISPSPIATSSVGKFRVYYYRSLDDVDIRRGKIASTTATTIVLEDDSDLDNNALADAEYICISDINGTVQDYNVIASSYTSGTRTITIPSQTLVGGTADYITVGRYTTTHSKLPSEAERVIKIYAQKRLMDTDESTRSVVEDSEFQAALSDILQTFSDVTQDIEQIPIIDWEMMS